MWISWFLFAQGLAQSLPPVDTQTLSGRSVVLPAAASAERTVLLLAFRQRHQDDLDAWRPHLAALAAPGEVDWVELPYVDVPRLLKGIIRAAMDRSIDDPVTRDHFAPVWGSPAQVQAGLQITDDEQIVVLVVDRGGEVLWRRTGPPGADGPAALEAALGR